MRTCMRSLPPLSTSLTRGRAQLQVCNVLQLMNLYLHNIITPNPYFTLCFTLGVMHSVGLENIYWLASFIIASFRVLHKRQSIFIALKIPCASPVYPSSSSLLHKILGYHWSFYCLQRFTFSRMSYSESQSVSCSVVSDSLPLHGL